MKSFLATLGFLTIVPIPRNIHEDSAALKHAVWWFPVIGLIVGSVLAGLDRLFNSFFPETVSAALTVISWIIFTRGLHVDGLADTADGLLSFRSREKMLEIMREPRTGPMGVMAVVSGVALKTAAVFSFASSGRWAALFLAVLAGRCVMGLVMGLFPYARAEGGLATALEGPKSWGKAFWSVSFLLVTAGLLFRFRGIGTGLVCLVLGWALSVWIRRRIGGYTGDTLGATCELTETCQLILLLLFIR